MAGVLKRTSIDVNRLVVLVPDQGVYGIELARRIWALAEPCELQVLFLCAPGYPLIHESALRMRLITLASQIRSERISVEICIEKELNWVRAAWKHCKTGDIVICCAEQMVETRLLGSVPLCQVLDEALNVPIFVLSGLYQKESAAPNNRVRQAARWIVPIVTAIVFVLVETHIDTIAMGFANTLLVASFAITEIGLIAAMSLFI